MTFREEVKKSLLKNDDLEKLLDRIEMIHRRHRNIEVEAKLAKGKSNNTKLGNLLFRRGDK